MPDGGFDLSEVNKTLDSLKTGFEEFKTKNDAALAEMAKKGDVDPVLTEQIDKINEALNEKQARLDKFEAAMKRKSARVLDADGNEIDLDKKAQDWANGMAALRREVPSEFGAEALDEYKAAFNRFIRKGGEISYLKPEEVKALSVGIDPDGGYTVHPDMNGQIVNFVYESSPVRQYVSQQTIGVDALEGMTDLGEAGSGWVAETAARPATTTPQLGTWRIPVHELYAYPKATQKILDDSSMNVEAWLAGKVSEKFARDEAAAFVNGNGIGKPRGFLTYDDWTTAGTFEDKKIEQFDTGANGAFAATPNGADVLLDAIYGLKAQYRSRAVWAMNRFTTAMVRKLKDSEGNYLWQPGIVAGQPATVLGYSVASFEDMPSGTTTGALAIAFADWRATYQIVDRHGIRTLRDPYTDKPYVGFYSIKRVGGDVVNFDSIKLIKFAS